MIGIVAALAALAVVLWWVPLWLTPVEVIDAKERVQLQNELRRTWAQIALGVLVLGTLYVTWRRAAAAERAVAVAGEQQITERFTRAIEQLGSDNIAVRLGGIYALERIAKDSPDKDHWQVMEVLTAYVRENARWEGKQKEDEVLVSDGSAVRRVPTDIQAVLTVLCRRDTTYESGDQHLDLSGADLPYANLARANLSGANISLANLSVANLDGVNLQGATLDGTVLRGANLRQANLQGVRFFRADLEGAMLFRADLRKADLVHAGLQRVDLWGANLQRAVLAAADLQGANLEEADLQRASLQEADLREALVQGANFQGADLVRAYLKGVTDLTREQLESAVTDGSTTLPDHLLEDDPASGG